MSSLMRSFNPTMVRLLQVKQTANEPATFSFNPTMVRLLLCGLALSLSGVVVSIPQWCDCCVFVVGDDGQLYYGFNPTMVRLLQLKPQRLLLTVRRFQSHNGAIAAADCLEFLKSQPYVSIPQWCDCCKLLPLPSQRLDKVSIPQWCDCCSYLNARQ